MSEKVLGLKECIALDKVIVNSKLSEKQKDKLMNYTCAISVILSGKDKEIAWKLIDRANKLQKRLNKLVSVRLASESVDLKKLKKFCERNRMNLLIHRDEKRQEGILLKDLLSWAEKEAKKNE